MRISNAKITHNTPLSFNFNGQTYKGYEGDSLASALLANNVHLTARSFKYHRPRGIFSDGVEEPNALVHHYSIGKCTKTNQDISYAEPNVRATTLKLYDGLQARSQNCWPNVSFDIASINDRLSPFLTAGFYYKTFMWPSAFWEKIYEPFIRRQAGLGKLAIPPSCPDDPDSYSHAYRHCDILIIGTGAAGLMAAKTAVQSGLEIVVAEQDFQTGGRLLSESYIIDSQPCNIWIQAQWADLLQAPNIRFMPRTCVFGRYDHNVYGALQTQTDKLNASMPRSVLWRITTQKTILCTGAHERSLAFRNNDRPGIMLASAARGYANRYGVQAFKKLAIFTNNNDGYRTARDLQKAGTKIVAILDTRPKLPGSTTRASLMDIRTISNARILNTHGRKRIHTITLENNEKITVDGLACAGGYNPCLQLSTHTDEKPSWQAKNACFIPAITGQNAKGDFYTAGAVKGVFSLSKILKSGVENAQKSIASLVQIPASPVLPNIDKSASTASHLKPFWWVGEEACRAQFPKRYIPKGRAFVDLQNDVTTKDIILASHEGFESPEHVKRYTTHGMATDQGKTGGLTGMAVLASAQNKAVKDVGLTKFRPPFTPIPIGAFGGAHRDTHFRATRTTPSHQFCNTQKAIFIDVGLWKRAQFFPTPTEKRWQDTLAREVNTVRNAVGVCDVSTLGKIDIQGTNAPEFLDRIYINGFSKLAIGKCRYGLMLKEDGHAFDDGTCARLSETHYLMSTTTAKAQAVMQHLQFCHQCLWPKLDVHIMSISEQWAQFALAGPKARHVLQRLVEPNYDVSDTNLPYMGYSDVNFRHGYTGRLFRLSFSGELAYELAVPARYGTSFMRAILDAGSVFGIAPYGTEALGAMRIEKGHIAGPELNGQTYLHNLGMERMMSRKKACIGQAMSDESIAKIENEKNLQLVGVRSRSPRQTFAAGAHFTALGDKVDLAHDQGYLTSACWSPSLNTQIGLGFLQNGAARHGDTILVLDLMRRQYVETEVCSPHFYDPQGEKLRV